MCRDGKAAGLCAAPARLCCDSAEMARYAAGDELGRAFSLAEVRPAIYITENGQSCNDRIFLDGCVHDPDRIDFLHRYLLALRAAAEGGADVRGYFHWALTDNFEWSEGYRERFGLVYIDYVTGARIPKDSAAWYAETVRANGENL